MNLIFLTGYSGAGKTTVSDHLIKQHGVDYVSFRTTTKSVAENHGYSHVDYLEKVDNATIFKEVSAEIIREISQKKAKTVLIDGLYHLPYVQPITEAFQDAKSIILAVEADRTLRGPRMDKRSPNDNSALNNIDYLDNYKDSIGIVDVLNHADVIIVNEQDIPALLKKADQFALSL